MKSSSRFFTSLLLILSYIVITSYINPYLFSQTNESLDSLYKKFLQLRAPELLPQNEQTEELIPENRKCGFEIVNTVKINFEYFSTEQQAVVKPLLQRPVMHTSVVSPSGFFRIHYDTAGVSIPSYINNASIETNIQEVVKTLDSTYSFEVDYLGYPVPPPDGNEGGDNLYDVYIINQPSGLYGFTLFETEIEPGSDKYTSYQVIDNNYTGYFSEGVNGLQVTAAHEFHHAIQGGNYIFRPSDTYFYEITSTAMEEFVYDDVNDYYAYMSSYFAHPDRPMPLQNGYNLAIWNLYIKENLGYAILKRQWELMINMRAILSIEQSLNEYATSIRRELSTFGIWTYYTGYRAISGMYFDEASNYPIITPTATIQFSPPSVPIQLFAGPATNNLFKFTIPSGNHTLFAIITNGDAIAANQNVNQLFAFQYYLFDYQEPGSTPIMNNYYYTFESQSEEHFKIVHIFDDIIATSVIDNSTITHYKLYQNYPNPFNPMTTIKYSVGNSYKISIKIYDVLGSEIAELLNETKKVGDYEIEFNTSNLPSGVYFYRLQAVPNGRQAGSFVETKKMVLLR